MSNDGTPAHSGKTLAGLILLAVGVTLLLRQLDLFFFPSWLFSWPVLLIVIGIFSGAKSNYQNAGWIIPVLIGTVFLIGKALPGFAPFSRQFSIPTLIIVAGIYMLVKRRHHHPRRRHHHHPQQQQGEPNPYDNQDLYAYVPSPPPSDYPISGSETSEYIEATAVLGGIKRNVFSKNVTGGEITSFLGGVEINLTQADIQGQVVLDVTQVMGGTKLIVPSHWDVVSDMTAVLGGIEDKRMIHVSHIDKGKRLIIKGTSVMGGVQITSYG